MAVVVEQDAFFVGTLTEIMIVIIKMIMIMMMKVMIIKSNLFRS